MTDTFQRSCAHWSEAGRAEMDRFYALASVDYKHLVEAIDWKNWFEERQKVVGQRNLKLLDVACGSGKFPSALKQFGRLSRASILPVEYSLLDPSAFSISETRKALFPPFHCSAEFEMTLQALACEAGAFDIVWATHALYAVPKEELQAALERFVFALDGAGFIAHATTNSHYLRFYRHYLNGFKDGSGVPYSSAELIGKTLKALGVDFRIKQISYQNTALENASEQVEGYLQRCIFDDTIGLDVMLKNSETGPYLNECLQNGTWHFDQQVMLFFLTVAST